ncbi:MAG: YigZ family protein [Pseudomonadota bacterium]
MSYSVPIEQAVAEITIKKSRFIAYARHIVSREAGMVWLAEIKAEYPDARHHCWAYLIGHPNCATNAGMGDDGEPGGTAGKPILNVLNHKGVGDIMIIVVRYFGGIKLGAGGLTRAYGQAAQAVMEVLPSKEQVLMDSIDIECDFSLEQQIRHWTGLVDGIVSEVNYAQKVQILLLTPQDKTQILIEQLESIDCYFKSVSE